jgi:hypothetical protein
VVRQRTTQRDQSLIAPCRFLAALRPISPRGYGYLPRHETPCTWSCGRRCQTCIAAVDWATVCGANAPNQRSIRCNPSICRMNDILCGAAIIYSRTRNICLSELIGALPSSCFCNSFLCTDIEQPSECKNAHHCYTSRNVGCARAASRCDWR